MTLEHIPGIMAIENVAYEFPWTDDLFRDCLLVGYLGWVALAEKDSEPKKLELVGYVLMSTAANEAHVLNLCVGEAHRRLGVARRLLQECLDYSKFTGVESAYLEVRPSNPGAMCLYQDMGFQQIGMRKDYYPATNNTREDALVLSKIL
ncbi:MAG: ribosomal protein S18-alanine N-acetyltransferase [Gammaproteobacteria bacterium]